MNRKQRADKAARIWKERLKERKRAEWAMKEYARAMERAMEFEMQQQRYELAHKAMQDSLIVAIGG